MFATARQAERCIILRDPLLLQKWLAFSDTAGLTNDEDVAMLLLSRYCSSSGPGSSCPKCGLELSRYCRVCGPCPTIPSSIPGSSRPEDEDVDYKPPIAILEAQAGLWNLQPEASAEPRVTSGHEPPLSSSPSPSASPLQVEDDDEDTRDFGDAFFTQEAHTTKTHTDTVSSGKSTVLSSNQEEEEEDKSTVEPQKKRRGPMKTKIQKNKKPTRKVIVSKTLKVPKQKKIKIKDIKSFKCDICEKTYASKGSLDRHPCNRTTAFFCEQCWKPFGTASHLKDHQRMHSDVMAYQCDRCGKKFRFRSSLASHKTNVRCTDMYDENGQKIKKALKKKEQSGEPVKKKEWPCPDCGKLFSSPSAYSIHARKYHDRGKPAPYHCSVCYKKFFVESCYKKHIESHEEKTKFECYNCHKVFVMRSVYEKHVLTCENAVSCEICGKQFKTKRAMKEHERSHSAEYQCENCFQSFKYRSSFAHHKKICMKYLAKYLGMSAEGDDAERRTDEGFTGSMVSTLVSHANDLSSIPRPLSAGVNVVSTGMDRCVTHNSHNDLVSIPRPVSAGMDFCVTHSSHNDLVSIPRPVSAGMDFCVTHSSPNDLGSITRPVSTGVHLVSAGMDLCVTHNSHNDLVLIPRPVSAGVNIVSAGIDVSVTHNSSATAFGLDINPRSSLYNTASPSTDYRDPGVQ